MLASEAKALLGIASIEISKINIALDELLIKGTTEIELELVRTLGSKIGYGQMIYLAHKCWDELLSSQYGITKHSEAYQLAAAELILEKRAREAASGL